MVNLEDAMETALRRPVPCEEVCEEVAEGKTCEEENEEQRRRVERVIVEYGPRREDCIVNHRGCDAAEYPDDYRNEPPIVF